MKNLTLLFVTLLTLSSAAFARRAPLHRVSGPAPRPASAPRSRKAILRVALFLGLVASASAQWLTVSGGGTIGLGQSANIVASPTTGVATAYDLIENGVVIQTVGTFGIGGSSTDVGKPHTFTVTPPAPGTYVYSAQVALNVFRGHLDYLPSDNSVTLTVVAPSNHAPTIAWTSAPGTVGSGQTYTISAHGHDDDGNLTAVSIWKNGQPFAFAGGGDGYDGDSDNPTSDTGPQTVTFTAQSFDGAGAASATISQSVTITAPNRPPTASISGSTALQVGEVGSWTFSAADLDGNLANWRFYASTNSNPSWSAASGGSAGPGSYSASFPSPGNYTWVVDAKDSVGATGSASITVTVAAPVNHPPVISWNTAPGTVASNQSYTISAHGHDQDGNLTQVNVWKNGVPFAFAGGGNGTDGDSGNPTSDTGPATVTFTAQTVDSNGAASATISQTVTVTAPNQPPTASISGSTALQVGEVGSWTFSAADADGNLAKWRFYASTNPSPQWSAASGSSAGPGSYSASFPSPGSYTWIVDAQDAVGASGSASITVSVTAPVNHPPTIAWTTTPGTVASGQSYTISAHGRDSDGNLTAVSIWKSGQPFAFAGGGNGTDGDSSNPTSDTGPQTVTFAAQATDSNGATSATISQSVTVGPPSSVTASITANPTSATATGATTVSWASANATSVSVTGSGLNSSASSGSQSVSGLAAGNYTYTITAQGYGGPVTQTTTFTVNTAASVSAAISASPSNCMSPGSSTVTWSCANATSVSVTGNGVNSTAASGSQTVSGLSAGTYTYTITAQGPNGPATQTATVTVNAPATVAGSISVSPVSGTDPASTIVSWSTSNATSVLVAGAGINSTAANGSQTVSGLSAGTYTYTLTAQGSGGPLTRTATFTVSAPLPTVTGSISANPTSGTAPGSTTISWNTSNATSVSVSGSGISSAATSGSQMVSGLPAGTYTYTLTAQGNGGPVTQTATITVNPGAAVTASMSISPTTMNMGGTATLTWTTANAISVNVTGYSITGSPYQTSPSLVVNIGGLPPGTYTYSLVAQGTGGPITKTATIVVNATDGLDANLVISPAVIYSNQSATMSWNITGANFKWVHGLLPNFNGVSVYPAPASGSTTLSGLAPGTYSYRIEYGPGAFSATRTTDSYLTVVGVNRTVSASATPAGTGSVIGAGTYQEGTTATLTATPDATHVFSSWSGDLSGTSNPITFTVGAQNYNAVANFAPAVVSLKYRGGGAHTLLAAPKTPNGAPFVIQVP